jgi:tRNA(fMet)-specific endonuclease VapC
VTGARGLVLLDTNVLIHVARGGTAAERIEARFALRSRRGTPLLSVVSVGESLAMAKRNGWGGPKLQRLADAMENLVIVDLNREPILQSYAAIDAHLAGAGTPIGQQNDLWIAATAAATGAVLLTTDRDFDKLHPSHLEREWIDPATLR